jgi:hypothetical protein
MIRIESLRRLAAKPVVARCWADKRSLIIREAVWVRHCASAKQENVSADRAPSNFLHHLHGAQSLLWIHDRSARQGNSHAIGEGATVGFVGNSESLELAHLHLETRRVREETDAGHLPGVLLGAREYTVVSDPRNVLPLVEPQVPLPQCLRRLAVEPQRYWLGNEWTLRLE